MPASIEQVLQHDHQQLEDLLDATSRSVHEQHWQHAAAQLEQFRHGLVDAHMAVEEKLVFPAFEAGDDPGAQALTAILRKGHQDLRVFLMEMADAIAAHDDDEFAALLRTVRALLKQHDSKEESELYPHVATMLPDQGRAAGEHLQRLQQPAVDRHDH